jgi:ATP-dependent Lon protease
MATTDSLLLDEITKLKTKLGSTQLPPDLFEKIGEMITRLERTAQLGQYSEEYEKVSHYIDWIVSIPWNQKTEDRLDLQQAKQILDQHHYGLEDVKTRILEYISVLKLQSLNQANNTGNVVRAPILCLVGLVGTGKTTFAYSLAEAMGRSIARIPFGGMGSARDLRGQSRLHLESEPGYVIKALVKAKSRNPIILLDEIDRVTAEARADIMGVLVELLDPEQNAAFVDHYVDYPVNLSEVLFIATANNTDNLATAVFDRLEPISVPSYSDDEKIVIAKQYLLPRAIKEAGLPEGSLSIDETLWHVIVRPLGYDAGIRTLQRTIKSIAAKVARLLVEGRAQQVHLTESNIKEFLPSY